MNWQSHLDLLSANIEEILSSMLAQDLINNSVSNLQVVPCWEILLMCWRTELEIEINLKTLMNRRPSLQWHKIWNCKISQSRNTGTYMNCMSTRFSGKNSANEFRGWQIDQESETSHWKFNSIFGVGVCLQEKSLTATCSNPRLDWLWKLR